MITIDQVADIKKKLDVLKEKKARAEGAMEAIRSRWKDEYQCDSKDAVEAKVRSLEEETTEEERRITVLLDKIDKAYPWETVVI